MKKRNRSTFNHLFSSRRAPGNIARPVAVLFCLLAFGMVLALWRDRIPMAPAAVSAQEAKASPDDLWQDGADPALQFQRAEKATTLPRSYRAVRLNRDALERLLGRAPMEGAAAAGGAQVEMTLPLPDGTFAKFHIEESPVMEPALAAQFPMIKTYQGRGIDDPGATVRFDWSPLGFHALILSSKHGSVYIDPHPETGRGDYISYFKRDYRREDAPFQCLVDRKLPAQNLSGSRLATSLSDSKLRIYRLAVAADSNFTKYSDIKYSGSKGGATPAGTVETAMSAIATIVNRVNAIYKRDVAVFFKLVGDQQGRSIIFSDPMDDPFYDKNTQSYLDIAAMAIKNQGLLDTKIGTGNYDIGHVLGRDNPEGVTFGSSILLCRDGEKALSGTMVSSPFRIDPIEVQVFAHELGHQLGAEHTYNGLSDQCGGQRVGEFAVEPGSGSTIMSYAGRCKPQQLQQMSDDYFHVVSIEQMRGFITSDSSGKCGTSQDTGKVPPSVIAGPAISIPKGTPFTLTAFGSEAALDYCWEECDLGLDMPSGPNTPLPDTDADGKPRPIFRSFKPEPNPTRTFPRMGDLLSGVPGTGEALPTITREMVFKVTVRDNHLNGGGVASGETRVIVDASTGPLVVTQPAKGQVWERSSTQIVKWNVARADTLAERVHILLSIDGGKTFPIVLAANTPNDGAATVTVPIVPTKTARIKVEAVGNIFFNISDGFEIACAPLYITDEPDDVAACPGQPGAFAVSAAGANPRYQWHKDGRPIDIRSPKFTIGAVTANDVGAYHVVITDDCGASVTSRTARLSLTPAPVIVTQPADAALCAGQQAVFSVSASGDITRYEWYKNGVFVSAGNTLQVVAAPANEGLYHAVAIDKCGRRAESRKARLSLGGAITITRHPANATACAGQSVTFSVEATGGNLKYKWRKNGGNIPGEGAEGSSFTIPAISAADAGAYSVIVYNGCGTTRESAAAALTLATGCPVNNAQFVSQSAPTEMQAGQLYTVVVKMKNTGTTTWTSAGGYKLGSQNPADNRVWGMNRVELPAHIPSAEPNREVTFGIPVYAPLTQGVYNMQWQMTQEGVGRFGSLTPNLSIRVGPPPPDNAWFVSQSAPLTMTANQRYNVSITMKNVGSNTWTTAVGYKLVSRGPANWGISEVPLPASVAPGAEATFNFTVTAPASSLAPYRFEWQMMRSGFGFGAVSSSLWITVK